LHISFENLYFTTLAGTPATIAKLGTSLVTTAPAATIAPCPIFLQLCKIIEFNPIHTSLPIIQPFE